MVLVTQENAVDYMINTGLVVRTVYPITKWEHFIINEPIRIRLTNNHVIHIPRGFVFDGSSSPRYLWSLFPSYGDFLLAALIHDYLYKTHYLQLLVGNYEAQLFADEEMLSWSMIVNPHKPLDNNLRYKAVRAFGKNTYIN